MNMMTFGFESGDAAELRVFEITRDEIVEGFNRRLASYEKVIAELEAAIPDNAPDVMPILRDEMLDLRDRRDELRYARDHLTLDKAHRVTLRQLVLIRRDTLPLKVTVEGVIRRGREPRYGVVIGNEVAR